MKNIKYNVYNSTRILIGCLLRVRGVSLLNSFGLPPLRGLSGVSVSVVPFTAWWCSGGCSPVLPRRLRGTNIPIKELDATNEVEF